MNTKKLYHYTSAPALVNILNHGYLRATLASQLADGSECRHAIDTLRRLRPDLRNNRVWTSFESTLLSMPRYVVCFSQIRNDPYQWQHYGSQGAGACIVFDPEKAANALTTSGWDRFQCHYDQTEQRNLLENLAEEVVRSGEAAVAERMEEFWEYNIRFKRQEFAGENEVRFVSTTQRKPQTFAGQDQNKDLAPFFTITAELDTYSHPSECFDEKYRPFELFLIKGAIDEIILGPRFVATRNYWKHLESNFAINQI